MTKPKNNSIRKMRWKLFLLGLVKIPIIHFVKPKLIQLDDNSAILKIRLRRRTKNHLNSMYFGALAVGADVAAGLHAFYFSEQMSTKISFAFKSMNAEFLMRAESHVLFKSDQGMLVKTAMQKSKESRERVNQPILISAENLNGDQVARFEMVVSVKVK